MRVDVITIFPGMFDSVLNASIIKRAVAKKLVSFKLHDLRDYTDDKHRSVDDSPCGGGAGMVMKAEPIYKAIKAAAGKTKVRKILLTPDGKTFSQKKAIELAKEKRLLFFCGHYEGFDERARDFFDEEISVGDYVLTGGELPAMTVIDAVVRLIPGVLGNKESAKNESFMEGMLDFPHYTKPAVFRGKKVPEVLLSGNHKKIEEWRKEQAVKRTKEKRPDLKGCQN